MRRISTYLWDEQLRNAHWVRIKLTNLLTQSNATVATSASLQFFFYCFFFTISLDDLHFRFGRTERRFLSALSNRRFRGAVLCQRGRALRKNTEYFIYQEVVESNVGSTIMSCLIDGLPDAVALRCLARVPFYLHPRLQLVCRSWRAALLSPELFKVRTEVRSTEELLCVCAFEPENVWQLYDPRRDFWLTIPVLPSQIRHLAHFGVVSISGKLFVLGGGSDAVDPLTGDHDGIFATNEVWSYDPVLRRWARRASMLVPRAMFACCVMDGKIVVAGGFTNCRKSISKAEIYDPEKDMWDPMPDLQHMHNSACSGIVIGGKVHVVHKGLSMVQIFESSANRWSVEDYGWLQGPMTVVHGELYVLSHGIVFKQYKDQRVKRMIASASDFQSRIGFGMIGLGEELYVIGGVIGPGRWNLVIKLLADVDVLAVGNERPTWRQVAPMTRCRGSILGCTLLRI